MRIVGLLWSCAKVFTDSGHSGFGVKSLGCRGLGFGGFVELGVLAFGGFVRGASASPSRLREGA